MYFKISTHLFICKFCMLRMYYLQMIKLALVDKKMVQSTSIMNCAKLYAPVPTYSHKWWGMHFQTVVPIQRFQGLFTAALQGFAYIQQIFFFLTSPFTLHCKQHLESSKSNPLHKGSNDIQETSGTNSMHFPCKHFWLVHSCLYHPFLLINHNALPSKVHGITWNTKNSFQLFIALCS